MEKSESQEGKISDWELKKILLIKDFSVCEGAIRDFYDNCENVNTDSSLSRKKNECRSSKLNMNFCLMSGFCPYEAKNLIECCGNEIPSKTVKLQLFIIMKILFKKTLKKNRFQQNVKHNGIFLTNV